MQLDELDAGILRLLTEDARLSYREIASRLGSTTPTISARVKTLEDIGVIQGYRAALDPSALATQAHVLTATTAPSNVLEVAEALREIPNVEEIVVLAGGALLARAYAREPDWTVEHLHDALTRIPGLVGYELKPVVRVIHSAGGLTNPPSHVRVTCHHCKGRIHGNPIRGKVDDRLHVFCCRQCHASFRERYETARAAARERE